MMLRHEALKVLGNHRTDEAVISTMTVSRDWPTFSSRPELDLRIRILMGHNAGLGLGVALAHPERRVWVLDGDGSRLMYMGYITDIANAAPKNLTLFVFENGTYETTGGQPLPLQGRLDFVAAAKGLGIQNSYGFDEVQEFEAKIGAILRQDGPTFVCLKAVPAGPGNLALPDVLAEIQRFRAALSGA